jgi:hypothetical protein
MLAHIHIIYRFNFLSKAISDQPESVEAIYFLLHPSHQRFTPASDWYLALPGNTLAGAR